MKRTDEPTAIQEANMTKTFKMLQETADKGAGMRSMDVITDYGQRTVLVLVERLGYFWVRKFSVGLNRAGNVQVWESQEHFKTLDEAETLYLNVLEMHGLLAFGDQLKASIGSGVRYCGNVR